MLRNYLYKYKFSDWITHKDGSTVTEQEKKERAKEIALDLCNHSKWNSHGKGISREEVDKNCKIKVIHSEKIDGLDGVLRKFWALCYLTFENTLASKVFISNKYCIIKSETVLMKKKD